MQVTNSLALAGGALTALLISAVCSACGGPDPTPQPTSVGPLLTFYPATPSPTLSISPTPSLTATPDRTPIAIFSTPTTPENITLSPGPTVSSESTPGAVEAYTLSWTGRATEDNTFTLPGSSPPVVEKITMNIADKGSEVINLYPNGTSYTSLAEVSVTYDKNDVKNSTTGCGGGPGSEGPDTDTSHDTYKDPMRWNDVTGYYALTIQPERRADGTSYIPGRAIAQYIYYAGAANAGGDSRVRAFTEVDEMSSLFCDTLIPTSVTSDNISGYIAYLGTPLDDLEVDPTGDTFSVHKSQTVHSAQEKIQVQWDIELRPVPQK